jgi:hypothetical protein
MLNSMRKSLDYYTRNFGPYAHKEARIVEFPRVARFAQAFPGDHAIFRSHRLHRRPPIPTISIRSSTWWRMKWGTSGGRTR